MPDYGLIGYPLGHSFSKKYFEEKFAREGIANIRYHLLELPDIRLLPELLKQYPELKGLNVTIPHKQSVLPFLHQLDPIAARIGAVNTIKIAPDGQLTGYNTDWIGFRNSLLQFIPENLSLTALILGTGGSSRAVAAALKSLGISYQFVSRHPEEGKLTYVQLSQAQIHASQLIVHTTPLGMYPDTNAFPDIPYRFLTENHFLFDLVYNPEETLFLQKGKDAGAKVKNGLEMLHQQAEAAWQIWNS